MRDCAEVRRLIRAGERESVREHLESCASCAEFADAFELLGDVGDVESPLDLDDAFSGVEARLRSGSKLRSALAEQPTGRRWLLVAATAAAAMLLIWRFKRRVDFDLYPLLRWLLEVGLFGGVTGAAVVRATRSLHSPPVPSWRTMILAVAILSTLAVPLLLPEAHLAHPSSLEGVGGDLLRRALACFGWGSAVSLTLGGPVILVSRGRPRLGALPVFFWLSMGLFAQAALHLHCPIVHPLHIGLGHTAIVPGLLLGYLAVRRLT